MHLAEPYQLPKQAIPVYTPMNLPEQQNEVVCSLDIYIYASH